MKRLRRMDYARMWSTLNTLTQRSGKSRPGCSDIWAAACYNGYMDL